MVVASKVGGNNAKKRKYDGKDNKNNNCSTSTSKSKSTTNSNNGNASGGLPVPEQKKKSSKSTTKSCVTSSTTTTTTLSLSTVTVPSKNSANSKSKGDLKLPSTTSTTSTTNLTKNNNCTAPGTSVDGRVNKLTFSGNGTKTIQAQRKFAQGCSSHNMMNSPHGTPEKKLTKSSGTKSKWTAPPSPPYLYAKRPKTEDFLTFLCYRGTPKLPPELEYFNYPQPIIPPKKLEIKRRKSNSSSNSNKSTTYIQSISSLIKNSTTNSNTPSTSSINSTNSQNIKVTNDDNKRNINNAQDGSSISTNNNGKLILSSSTNTSNSSKKKFASQVSSSIDHKKSVVANNLLKSFRHVKNTPKPKFKDSVKNSTSSPLNEKDAKFALSALKLKYQEKRLSKSIPVVTKIAKKVKERTVILTRSKSRSESISPSKSRINKNIKANKSSSKTAESKSIKNSNAIISSNPRRNAPSPDIIYGVGHHTTTTYNHVVSSRTGSSKRSSNTSLNSNDSDNESKSSRSSGDSDKESHKSSKKSEKSKKSEIDSDQDCEGSDSDQEPLKSNSNSKSKSKGKSKKKADSSSKSESSSSEEKESSSSSSSTTSSDEKGPKSRALRSGKELASTPSKKDKKKVLTKRKSSNSNNDSKKPSSSSSKKHGTSDDDDDEESEDESKRIGTRSARRNSFSPLRELPMYGVVKKKKSAKNKNKKDSKKTNKKVEGKSNKETTNSKKSSSPKISTTSNGESTKRPTRKTKENARMYLDLITKEFSSDEDIEESLAKSKNLNKKEADGESSLGDTSSSDEKFFEKHYNSSMKREVEEKLSDQKSKDKDKDRKSTSKESSNNKKSTPSTSSKTSRSESKSSTVKKSKSTDSKKDKNDDKRPGKIKPLSRSQSFDCDKSTVDKKGKSNSAGKIVRRRITISSERIISSSTITTTSSSSMGGAARKSASVLPKSFKDMKNKISKKQLGSGSDSDTSSTRMDIDSDPPPPFLEPVSSPPTPSKSGHSSSDSDSEKDKSKNKNTTSKINKQNSNKKGNLNSSSTSSSSKKKDLLIPKPKITSKKITPASAAISQLSKTLINHLPTSTICTSSTSSTTTSITKKINKNRRSSIVEENSQAIASEMRRIVEEKKGTKAAIQELKAANKLKAEAKKLSKLKAKQQETVQVQPKLKSPSPSPPPDEVKNENEVESSSKNSVKSSESSSSSSSSSADSESDSDSDDSEPPREKVTIAIQCDMDLEEGIVHHEDQDQDNEINSNSIHFSQQKVPSPLPQHTSNHHHHEQQQHETQTQQNSNASNVNFNYNLNLNSHQQQQQQQQQQSQHIPQQQNIPSFLPSFTTPAQTTSTDYYSTHHLQMNHPIQMSNIQLITAHHARTSQEYSAISHNTMNMNMSIPFHMTNMNMNMLPMHMSLPMPMPLPLPMPNINFPMSSILTSSQFAAPAQFHHTTQQQHHTPSGSSHISSTTLHQTHHIRTDIPLVRPTVIGSNHLLTLSRPQHQQQQQHQQNHIPIITTGTTGNFSLTRPPAVSIWNPMVSNPTPSTSTTAHNNNSNNQTAFRVTNILAKNPKPPNQQQQQQQPLIQPRVISQQQQQSSSSNAVNSQGYSLLKNLPNVSIVPKFDRNSKPFVNIPLDGKFGDGEKVTTKLGRNKYNEIVEKPIKKEQVKKSKDKNDNANGESSESKKGRKSKKSLLINPNTSPLTVKKDTATPITYVKKSEKKSVKRKDSTDSIGEQPFNKLLELKKSSSKSPKPRSKDGNSTSTLINEVKKESKVFTPNIIVKSSTASAASGSTTPTSSTNSNSNHKSFLDSIYSESSTFKPIGNKEKVKKSKSKDKDQNQNISTPKSTLEKEENLSRKFDEDFDGFENKLVDAPVYYPTDEEFQDPMKYIESIRTQAEVFGIAKIVPPKSFRPECKVEDDMRFTAYNHYIGKMFKRWGPNVHETLAMRELLKKSNVELNIKAWPMIGGMEIDLYSLYHHVKSFGGLSEVIEKQKWGKVSDAMHIPKSANDRVSKLDGIYVKHILPYESLSESERKKILTKTEKKWNSREKKKLEKLAKSDEKNRSDDEDSLDEFDDCIFKGKSTPLSSYYRVARNTHSMIFPNNTTGSNSESTSDVESEYWKHVRERKRHICVYSGSIDCSGPVGWGFPLPTKASSTKHPWNLKVLANSQGSVLKSMGPVMGVNVPTLHIGMVFTSYCWYRDPHGLPWVEYLHSGANKVWYAVPSKSEEIFHEAMKKLVRLQCKNKEIWLASDSIMIPPEELIANRVPLCRTVQKPGEFLIVFPKVFTSSVCTGYLISESVCFAPYNWLKSALSIFKIIRKSQEPPVFSLEKLLVSILQDNRASDEGLSLAIGHMKDLVKIELNARKKLKEMGVVVGKPSCGSGADSTSTNSGGKNTPKKNSKKKDEEEDVKQCEKCNYILHLSYVFNKQKDFTYCLQDAIEFLSKHKAQVKTSNIFLEYTEDELESTIKMAKSRISTKSASNNK